MNEENQVYLLKYDESILVSTLASVYQLCGKAIADHPTFDPSDESSTGAVIRECLSAIIKVLINLTHRFNRQCKRLYTFAPTLLRYLKIVAFFSFWK